MSETKPRRFYTDVTLAEEDGFFLVELDGRRARTPQRRPLGAKARALAEAVAAEWEAQTETIDLAGMPLTRLQGLALDGAGREEGGQTAEWAETILAHSRADLLCYRAEAGALRARQDEIWQPILDRLGARYGADFAVTEGILAVDQPPALGEAIGTRLGRLEAGALLGTRLLTEIAGSAALALATLDGDMGAEDAFAASRLDETYQAENWGFDAEAKNREDALRRDFLQAARFLTLSQSEGGAA